MTPQSEVELISVPYRICGTSPQTGGNEGVIISPFSNYGYDEYFETF